MASHDSKKTLYILFAVLGVVIIGGGIWFFQFMKPVETLTFDVEGDAQVSKVYAIKQLAAKNVIDFMGSKTSQATILDQVYNDPQYQALKDFEVVIDIKEGIGNEEPFAPIVLEDVSEEE
ncbi:hypothetical protein C4566_00620 [Candidatus Parcubacteria bacterium]|nr:MAG: hypothetical protein C4566_00620 [Candidatus Parcubacteria bacterium]